jgi:hypothetical protein
LLNTRRWRRPITRKLAKLIADRTPMVYNAQRGDSFDVRAYVEDSRSGLALSEAVITNAWPAV